jgi:rubredoxin
MTERHDKRRRQWFPFSAYFAVGEWAAKVKRRFGRDGLLVWACYLAACKRNHPQGQFTYAFEDAGWRLLGLGEDRPDFTLEEFFRFTGQHKKTSKRRSGDVLDIICRDWADWNKDAKRDLDALRNSSKRAEKPGDIPDTIERQSSDIATTENDVDVESETPQTPLSSLNPECPVCGLEKKNVRMLEEHLANVHGVEPAVVVELRTAS